MSVNISKQKYEKSDYANSEIWDNVADCFSRVDNKLNYAPGYDNLKTIWPVLYNVLNKEFIHMNNTNYYACDFGCGTGLFAQKLFDWGFETFACDISKKMIEKARLSTSKEITYEIGNLNSIEKHTQFNLIVSIMVFQFIFDIKGTIEKISKLIQKDGILFFAIHNREYVYNSEKYCNNFRNLENKDSIVYGDILIDNQWIKSYNRTPQWYNNILSSAGFVYLGSSFCDSTSTINKTNSIDNDFNFPKYYVSWYKKL